MARQIPHGGGTGKGRGARAGSLARKAWPIILMAWERWQALPEHEKERYRQRARKAAERGRQVAERARRRRRKGFG